MRYEVIGPLPVAGRRRGELVDLDETQANIPALIQAGHIKPARAKVRRSDGEPRTR